MSLLPCFPGLEDLLEVHGLFLESLRELRDDNNYVVPEIGDVLLARFEGTEGGWFEKISARFCSCQSHTLKQLKAKQRRDPRFAQFIQEAESQARCRRLQLKDIVPIEMQRLTKYPLLLQNIAKYTEAPEERARVEHAAECCRHILHRVNQEVRDMENFMKMKDYQGRLDLSYMKQSSDPLLSDFKVSDITKRHLVHEGLLTWPRLQGQGCGGAGAAAGRSAGAAAAAGGAPGAALPEPPGQRPRHRQAQPQPHRAAQLRHHAPGSHRPQGLLRHQQL
ncbi:rho guanine nucleotide exchange factor 1 [Alligator mississippiensis]|uniref:rho guanine nucleotide exchange factor 1 n=1 Tax=Alligator mississippiensis TaxID=8496 RepID=UPI0028774B43|nr:rho guanine nucleotide exchange factor 1 [Alligator mississippiensis]